MHLTTSRQSPPTPTPYNLPNGQLSSSVYRCSFCGANECKLWRAPEDIRKARLRCYACACATLNRPSPGINRDGILMEDIGGVEVETDTIGWYVPAVPHLDGEGFWPYTAVPDEGVSWWTNLPTRPERDILDVEFTLAPAMLLLP